MSPEEAADIIRTTTLAGGKVLICGNGGSAAQAQHLAAELVVRYKRNRPAIAAIALTADTAVLTACANDFGYENVFSRQVEALGRPGDVLIALSTSGKSLNVLKAIAVAVDRGLAVIEPPNAEDTATSQELHLKWLHEVCEALHA